MDIFQLQQIQKNHMFAQQPYIRALIEASEAIVSVKIALLNALK